MRKHLKAVLFLLSLSTLTTIAQETRLLRQPTIVKDQITYCYGGDIWTTNLTTNKTTRLTSTPAVESNPHLSPDGKWIAFSSNRFGRGDVFLVPTSGGEAKRLTWHPSGSSVRGWSNDGKRILFASSRNTAPSSYNKLYTISVNGGPAQKVADQWAFSGSYASDESKIVIDRVSRWDTEWRDYRGGQNTPLIILDLKTQQEILLPNNKTTDKQPIWINDKIYFLSDRTHTSNIWSYDVKTKAVNQITKYKGTAIKSLGGDKNQLIYEQDGYLHLLNLDSKKTTQLKIELKGDFPWTATKWENVNSRVNFSSISPNGKRVLMSARGDIFTAPVEFGDSRNISQSSGAADRAPIWSPKGNEIAWFTDKDGKGYALHITNQDGSNVSKTISIGVSKMAWNPVWSPDGKYIAFTDDDTRVRIVNLETKKIQTIDNAGTNLERGRLGVTWSPDSNWVAYAKSGDNSLRQIKVWSVKTGETNVITNNFADSFSPAWDLDHKHLYFLASTDLALQSGWANTSAMTARPNYAVYVVNLNKKDESPFKAKSDEEAVKKENKKGETPKKKEDKKSKKTKKEVIIDFEGIARRILPLPIPNGSYYAIDAGPSGFAFISDRSTVHKFDLKKLKSKEFGKRIRIRAISPNGKHMLLSSRRIWKVIKTTAPNAKAAKTVKIDFNMKLDRLSEWNQMFEEAWRYERDYFYDPNLHGRNWNTVYKRYQPLVKHIKHRSDLNYILDQVNGELSVGHSFVRGGDYPRTDRSSVGLLGADFKINNNKWQIQRIYTSESWNPGLNGPLDQPGMNVKEDYYLVGINNNEITSKDNIYQFLDGTANKQTVIHINSKPTFEGSWKEIVKPIRSENSLRQRTWVEDNRRLVDKLSDGKLAYIWVPNTSGAGFVSFNRYFFAQQDKEGAVIDERFNGGGLLDDYMVDLMTRKPRAALTNEVPNGKPMRLPAGILGPKVLLINELAGSGGDYFPWVFRQQKAGLLIGTTTWGGLVKSSTHYRLIDGGSLTAPDNAVFDPVKNEWIAENTGVAPDIFVRQDALSLSQGKDPQLERAVKEALKQLKGDLKITVPKFPTPTKSN
ncbi:S41 family peptidase [Tenacibaculum jejuense]|uniref:Tricorn protease homolog n=1 Tax=Tenacibaculum jejuense TaxID=584609 RepID=A0A238UE58_9FLAO|nr:S41 family peptidase [Tenacibaculum jejuense]SNR17372.1 putative protease S41 family precursor [Tenacibaculum jejuense]